LHSAAAATALEESKGDLGWISNKLTNLEWLTLGVLKNLMKIKKFILKSARQNAINFFEPIRE
jgi:hypothetical protein